MTGAPPSHLSHAARAPGGEKTGGGRVLLTEILLPRIEKFEIEKLGVTNLSSTMVSNRIVPPSEIAGFPSSQHGRSLSSLENDSSVCRAFRYFTRAWGTGPTSLSVYLSICLSLSHSLSLYIYLSLSAWGQVQRGRLLPTSKRRACESIGRDKRHTITLVV